MGGGNFAFFSTFALQFAVLIIELKAYEMQTKNFKVYFSVKLQYLNR